MKKHLLLKIFATLLPAFIFAQNYGWMTLYKGFGYAFLALWIFNILLVLNAGKNKTLHEIFRVSEIGAFLLPISALIMTFVLGGKAIDGLEGQQAAQAGAAIGTAVGGIFAVGIAFIFGLFGGIILHLLANRFEKKMKEDVINETEQPGNFFERHKVITTIVFVIILSVINNLISDKKDGAQTQPKETAKVEMAKEVEKTTDDKAKKDEGKQETPSEKPQEATPSPIEITKTTITKDSIGTPNVTLTLKNTSTKVVDGVKVNIKTFNNFDEPANGFLTDNTFKGVSQETIPAGGTKTANWGLYNYDNATKATATVTSVHFADGTNWGE